VPFRKEKETRHYRILGKPADALFPTEMTTVTLSQLMNTIALGQFTIFFAPMGDAGYAKLNVSSSFYTQLII
jgi:hypothetical protein